MEISFQRKRQNGLEVYSSTDSERLSIVHIDRDYFIRLKNSKQEWEYPTWHGNKFSSVKAATEWLRFHDWKSATQDNISFDDDIFACVLLTSRSYRQKICAALSTKEFSKKLSRVKSSNVWAYGLNVKDKKDDTGDLMVQFKNKNGGAGDVYIYYDVPKVLYRKWQSAPSKGHFFWVYIRNHYKYSKLTGDKHGKLANAVN